MFEHYQWTVNPSRFGWLPCVVWLCIAVLVVVGNFTLMAKIMFISTWAVLGVYYWRAFKATQHFYTLTLDQDTLILRFNNGQQPELVSLIGTQRVLPWLVELTLLRESGKRSRWGIAADTMTRQDFRRLKVFVKTQSR